jgi:uncharacterized membrane protein (DUF2068 family)
MVLRKEAIKFQVMNNTPKAAPVALRSIALFEAAKGALVLAAACGLLSLRHTDLHAATDAFLLRHGINPEGHYMRLFIEGVARATNHHVGEIAALGFVYAAVRFVEGYGLWRAKHWAEWFAVISAGIYLPLELTHFSRHTSLFNAGIILLNMLIILYLASLLGQQKAERERSSAQTDTLKGKVNCAKSEKRKTPALRESSEL